MAVLPPYMLDCVAGLGLREAEGSPTKWIASAFFFGRHVKTEGDRRFHVVYLVTNRHVVNGHDEMVVRLNPESDAPAKEFRVLLGLDGARPRWFGHPKPDVDVAVIPVNPFFIKEQKLKFNFFTSDHDVADLARMNEIGLTEGDSAFVLGFPLGLVGSGRSYVVVRGATVARVRDAIARQATDFLVDAAVFPGNSGGPVVSKPEAIFVEGTKGQSASYLIGIVAGYVPYQEVAVSTQTRRPRMIFEENSSLASVYPVDAILEASEAHFKEATGTDALKSQRGEIPAGTPIAQATLE